MIKITFIIIFIIILFFYVSSGFEELTERGRDHVGHGDDGLDVSIS